MALSGMGLCMGRFLHGKVLAGLVVRISQSVQEVGVVGRWGELIEELTCSGLY